MLTPERETGARGKLAMVLLTMFVVSTGYFMVTPLLALDLTVSLRMPVAVAGVLVGAYVFVSQAMQPVVGLLISRYGTLPVLLSACAIALAGYLALAVARDTAWAAVAIVLAAAGNGGRTVSMKTFATSVWRGRGVRVLTLRSLVVNVAAALGPLLGVLLLHQFALALVTAGLVNVPLALLAVRLRRDLRAASGAAPATWRTAFAELGELVRHPLLRSAIAGSTGFWLLYSQLSLTVPLYVQREYHSGTLLGAMFVINAVLAAVVQATMLKGQRMQDNIVPLLAFGLLVTGCAFLPLVIRLHGAEVLAYVVLFTVGEAITVPLLDAVAGVAAGWSASAGSAFGLMAIGWAIGGLVGNDLGGLALSEAAGHQRLYLLWLGFFLIGGGSAALMIRARRHSQQREEMAS
jgi:DHA1 family multidrug resistance protein-like MFS transporter